MVCIKDTASRRRRPVTPLSDLLR